MTWSLEEVNREPVFIRLREAEGISGDLRTACRHERWVVRAALGEAAGRLVEARSQRMKRAACAQARLDPGDRDLVVEKEQAYHFM